MKRELEKYRYLFCFIILLVICWLFPYTGDDWAWGSSIGIERLQTWFENYSGRYLGNLIVLALTRSNLLKTVVMAFCLTGILWCLEQLTGNIWAFYIGTALLALTPKLVFRQAVVWTAGFSNYATSIFLTLLYLICIYPLFEEKKGRIECSQRPGMALLLFILGTANTLIVEHLTLYNLMLAVFVIVYVFVRYRKIFIQYVAYFIGTILGTYMMFSNSVYHSIAENADGYRSMASGTGIIRQAIESYFEVIYQELYMNNIWLNGVVVIISILLYKKIRTNLKAIHDRIMKACIVIMGIYEIYALQSVVQIGTAARQPALIVLEGIGTVLGALAVIVFGVLAGMYCGRLHKILFVMGSILCLTAPLFVVQPIGSRCFFATYVMFILLTCELFAILLEGNQEKLQIILIKRSCFLIGMVCAVFYFSIFASVYKVDRERLNYIRECAEQGKNEIEILHLPYESFIWTATPTSGSIWEERYKLFYGLPEDIRLKDVWSYDSLYK